MCLLEAGLLESVQGVYDTDAGKFKPEKLDALIQKFSKRYAGAWALTSLLQNLLTLDLEARRDFIQLKADLPEWFDLHTPKIGRLGSLNGLTPRKPTGQPLMIIDGTTSPKMEGRESTKEEIMEFFNVPIQRQLSDRADLANRSTSIPGDGERHSADAKLSTTSVQRKVFQDNRKNDNEDLFEANDIEKYCFTESDGFMKAVMDRKLEVGTNGKQVLRTYVRYAPITDPLEEAEARRYIRLRNIGPQHTSGEKGLEGTPFNVSLDGSGEFRLSKVDLNYSVGDSVSTARPDLKS